MRLRWDLETPWWKLRISTLRSGWVGRNLKNNILAFSHSLLEWDGHALLLGTGKETSAREICLFVLPCSLILPCILIRLPVASALFHFTLLGFTYIPTASHLFLLLWGTSWIRPFHPADRKRVLDAGRQPFQSLGRLRDQPNCSEV